MHNPPTSFPYAPREQSLTQKWLSKLYEEALGLYKETNPPYKGVEETNLHRMAWEVMGALERLYKETIR